MERQEPEKTIQGDLSGESVPPEQIQEVVSRILNSRHFSQAPKKRKFVQLICEYYLAGRAAEINEYLIGREVYERNDRYSPADDPVVRVAAHDVRKRLEQYYINEGRADEIRLDIPVGSYEPVFRQAPEAKAEESATALASSFDSPGIGPEGSRRLNWRIVAAAVGLILVGGIGGQIVQFLPRSEPSTVSAAEKAVYTTFWKPFLAGDDPSLLILSNPTVASVVNSTDPDVVSQKAIPLDEEQTNQLRLALQAADPANRDLSNPVRLHISSTDYTGIGEAIGAYRITDLFRSHGPGITLKQSRNVSPEDLRDRNLVMLGGVLSNTWSGKLPTQEDFHFTAAASLENRNPKAGEQSLYQTRFDPHTGRIIEDYALITVKPAAQPKNTILILEGIRSVSTGAAAEFVTNKAYLTELNRWIAQLEPKSESPRYFQALLKVGVENQMPITISVIAVHPIQIQKN